MKFGFKQISILLAASLVISGCGAKPTSDVERNQSPVLIKQEKQEQLDKAKKTEENLLKTKKSESSVTLIKKEFIPKVSKYKKDDSTEVLLDAPQISTNNIASYYKHGDHWHVLTKDGKEYITYKDPAKMSENEKNNLSSVAHETEKYSPEQIVAHIEKVYEKSGQIILKWLHVDHYHDSIYGISEDITGVSLLPAPEGYVADEKKEIPSFVDNQRYFREGRIVYFLEGKSQVEYKEKFVDIKKKSEINEGDYEKYGPKQIVEHTELIFEKKGLTIIKWLHVDHYHESAYGISEDINGIVIEDAPAGYVIDAKMEIPSTIEKKRFFRAGDKIYFISDDSKKKLSKQEEEKLKKELADKKEAEAKKLKEEQAENDKKILEDAEKNIPGEDVVQNIKVIYSKNGVEMIKWTHYVPGHIHDHDSIIGVTSDLDNVKIVDASKSEVQGLSEIYSTIPGKKYYMGTGSDSDTIYVVVEQEEITKEEPTDNENKVDSSKNKDEINNPEENIPGKEIVANVEKIYVKNNLTILKWLHKVPGHEHYHESAINFHEDIKNVKFITNPSNYKVDEKNEIPSSVAGKKFYRGIGEDADTIYIITEESNLFDSVEDKGDIVEVVYKGKEYRIFPQEYTMALKENKFFPNEESKITINQKFDKTRVLAINPDNIDYDFYCWAIWKDGDGKDFMKNTNNRFRWYILQSESEQYTEISVDEQDTEILDTSYYELSEKDNGALLKVAVVDQNETVLDEAKYLIKFKSNSYDGKVSESTKEKIKNARKIYLKGGEQTLKWWHINHWHYEPTDWYGDLVIEQAPSDYKRDESKRIDELSLDDELLDKVYYIEEDKILYVIVERADFLKLKADEIIRRIENVKKAQTRDEKTEALYGEEEQKLDILRFMELYSQLNEGDKDALLDEKTSLEKALAEINGSNLLDENREKETTKNKNEMEDVGNTESKKVDEEIPVAENIDNPEAEVALVE